MPAFLFLDLLNEKIKKIFIRYKDYVRKSIFKHFLAYNNNIDDK